MTENWKFRRRTFLKHGAQAATLAGLSGLFPETLRRALAVEPDIRTGTIQDVQHVVILMQENRSFDHYFGHLNGVRGFNDPRALKRQDGKPVWYQNYKYEFSPYHWDTKVTSAQWVSSQNHEWSAFHAIWNQGRNDKWMAVQYPEAMGYFKRGDIPYYYALADAFTLCEAYHQSMMGPTNPNRLYHMSGRAAPSGDGKDVHIGNDMGDGTIGASGTVDWTTYPERLSAAGVDWRVYQEGGYRSSSLWYLYVDAYWKYRLQEQNNYDCNALAWFRNFKNAPRDSDLWQRAMLARGVDQLRKDVQENTLPQVSWIVAPYCYCEHPWWGPSFGEYYVTRVLEALTSTPEVWARTVFILNYDEGDGFYDHASAPVPPWKDGVGLSTVSTAGEIEASSGLPIGLGHRVPLIAISPWSKGGKVSAEVFDHTSVLRFLERRFGVVEENISPWRRAVCGDLTSLFDFQGAGDTQVAPDLTNVPQSDARKEDAYWQQFYRPSPKYWSYEPKSLPGQEKGQRPTLAVPYQLHATLALDIAAGKLRLTLGNDGMSLPGNPQGHSAAVFQVQPREVGNPRFYTVTSYPVVQESGEELGRTLNDELDDLLDANGRYAFEVHGPNGFFREFHGNLHLAAQMARPEVSVTYQRNGNLQLNIRNLGRLPCSVTVTPNPAYTREGSRRYELEPNQAISEVWLLRSSQGWYDLSVTASNTEANYLRRLAGHVETGKPSRSDPLLDIAAT
ncbi:phospholipase C, phosphocholine-specific [Pseudomonas aeruginosa]|nr:phospholipase C, phosphocholine-specific [Pseudomonas aeruginosa]MBG5015660.1 phospholipase C, phosphocholine-specific [Pseudomonas aeruginosa]MBG5033199.1 phospholipase C, phosphocholine-specific [Pseudomonas aeruginosa]